MESNKTNSYYLYSFLIENTSCYVVINILLSFLEIFPQLFFVADMSRYEQFEDESLSHFVNPDNSQLFNAFKYIFFDYLKENSSFVKDLHFNTCVYSLIIAAFLLCYLNVRFFSILASKNKLIRAYLVISAFYVIIVVRILDYWMNASFLYVFFNFYLVRDTIGLTLALVHMCASVVMLVLYQMFIYIINKTVFTFSTDQKSFLSGKFYGEQAINYTLKFIIAIFYSFNLVGRENNRVFIYCVILVCNGFITLKNFARMPMVNSVISTSTRQFMRTLVMLILVETVVVTMNNFEGLSIWPEIFTLSLSALLSLALTVAMVRRAKDFNNAFNSHENITGPLLFNFIFEFNKIESTNQKNSLVKLLMLQHQTVCVESSCYCQFVAERRQEKGRESVGDFVYFTELLVKLIEKAYKVQEDMEEKCCMKIAQVVILSKFKNKHINTLFEMEKEMKFFSSNQQIFFKQLQNKIIHTYIYNSSRGENNKNNNFNIIDNAIFQSKFNELFNKLINTKEYFLNYVANGNNMEITYEFLEEKSKTFYQDWKQIKGFIKEFNDKDISSPMIELKICCLYKYIMNKEPKNSAYLNLMIGKNISEVSKESKNDDIVVLKMDAQNSWRFFKVTEHFCNLMKYSPSDLVNKSINILLPTYLKPYYSHKFLNKIEERDSSKFNKIIFPVDSEGYISMMKIDFKVLPSLDGIIHGVFNYNKFTLEPSKILFFLSKDSCVEATSENARELLGLSNSLLKMKKNILFDQMFSSGREEENEFEIPVEKIYAYIYNTLQLADYDHSLEYQPKNIEKAVKKENSAQKEENRGFQRSKQKIKTLKRKENTLKRENEESEDIIDSDSESQAYDRRDDSQENYIQFLEEPEEENLKNNHIIVSEPDFPSQVFEFFEFKNRVGPSLSVKTHTIKRYKDEDIAYFVVELNINNYDQYNKHNKYNSNALKNDMAYEQAASDYGDQEMYSMINSGTVSRAEKQGGDKKRKSKNQFIVIVKIVLVINVILFVLQLGQIIIVYLKSTNDRKFFDSKAMIDKNAIYLTQSVNFVSSLSFYTSLKGKDSLTIGGVNFGLLLQEELKQVVKQGDIEFNNMKVNATAYESTLLEVQPDRELTEITERWEIKEETVKNTVLLEKLLTQLIKTSDFTLEQFDITDYFLFGNIPWRREKDVPLHIISLFEILYNFYPSYSTDFTVFSKSYHQKANDDLANYVDLKTIYFSVLMGIKSVYVIGLIFAILYIGKKLSQNVDKVEKIYIDRINKNLQFTKKIRELFQENFNRLLYKQIVHQYENSTTKVEAVKPGEKGKMPYKNAPIFRAQMKDTVPTNKKGKIVRFVDKVKQNNNFPNSSLKDNRVDSKGEVDPEELDPNHKKGLQVANKLKTTTFILRTVTLIFSAYICYYLSIELLNQKFFTDLDNIHELNHLFGLRFTSLFNLSVIFKTNALINRKTSSEEIREAFTQFYTTNNDIFNKLKYNESLYGGVTTQIERFTQPDRCSQLVDSMLFFNSSEIEGLAGEKPLLVQFCDDLEFNKMGVEKATYNLVYNFQDLLNRLESSSNRGETYDISVYTQLNQQIDMFILIFYKFYAEAILLELDSVYSSSMSLFLVVNIIFYFAIMVIDLLLIFFLLYEQIIKRYVVKIKMINNLLNSLSIKN